MKIKKMHINIGLLILILSLTVVGTVNQSVEMLYQFETPKSSAGEISILSLESKNYTKPMEGYYPATFGFEDDKQGTVPNGWSDNSGSSCYIDVVDEHAGHNNVLRLVDGSSSYLAGALTPVFDESDHGTIEFWIKMDDANDHHYCLFYDTSGNRVFYFDFLFNRLYHNDGESKCIFEFGTINDNTWYHIAIHFELRAAGNYKGLSQYQVKYEIDGVESRVYNCENNYGNIAQFELRTYPGVESEIFYVDAIGLSSLDLLIN